MLRAVQEAPLLSAAITVGHMSTSLMIAKLVTGKIGDTHVEKRAMSAKTTRTVIVISGISLNSIGCIFPLFSAHILISKFHKYRQGRTYSRSPSPHNERGQIWSYRRSRSRSYRSSVEPCLKDNLVIMFCNWAMLCFLCLLRMKVKSGNIMFLERGKLP